MSFIFLSLKKSSHDLSFSISLSLVFDYDM